MNAKTLEVQKSNYQRTINEIEKRNLKLHHVASRKRYSAVNDYWTFEEYNGKFGKGILVRAGRLYEKSNRYEAIIYFIYYTEK
jgi:hypothetical protein